MRSKKIIREFDENPTSINKLTTRIYEDVYSTSVSGWEPPQKYQGVNISRLVEDFDPSEETIEIRFIRPQQNTDQFKLVAELFTKRVEFLKTERKAGRAVKPQSNPFSKGLAHNGYMQDKFNYFIKFTTEAGLAPEDYFHLIGDEFTARAWNYLSQKYPGNSPQKLKFLQGLATDSAYDKSNKGNFLLEQLSKLSQIDQEHERVMASLIERSEDSPEIISKVKSMLSSHPKWSHTEIAKLHKNDLSKGGLRNSCLNFIRNILVPFPGAP